MMTDNGAVPIASIFVRFRIYLKDRQIFAWFRIMKFLTFLMVTAQLPQKNGTMFTPTSLVVTHNP